MRMLAAGLTVSLVLPACAPVGPDYATPDIPVPDYWNTAVRSDLESSNPDISNWWRRFHDPTLNKLIALAAASNRELAIAAERIEEARARAGVARGGLAPFVSTQGSLTENRATESQPFQPLDNPSEIADATIDAGWEIDFVGGLRRAVQAARRNLAATREFHRDAMVVIYAEVASTYIEYRTLQERLAVTEENIKRQRESVQLTSDRKNAGLAPEIDVSQARENLASSEAVIPQIRTRLAAAKNRLALLVGRYPGALDPLLGKGTIPTLDRSAAIGLPVDLLRARPDIRAAERELAAQTARIGLATAELYPKFSLLGTFGLQTIGATEDFLSAPSRTYAFGPAFRWRIFGGGRLRANVRLEESRARQALLNYQNAVLEAVADVETALAALAYERRRLAHLKDAVTFARKTVDLIRDNYKNGLVNFQNVLDAERTIFSNQDQAAVSRGLIARNHVALYRALGGGTSMKAPRNALPPDKPSPPPAR